MGSAVPKNYPSLFSPPPYDQRAFLPWARPVILSDARVLECPYRLVTSRFCSDDVFVVRTDEPGDHVRDQWTREVHSGRTREAGGRGFGGERAVEPSHQVGSNREPSGKSLQPHSVL